VRGFAAGALSLVFALDLAQAGYAPWLVGTLVGVALAAGAGWSLAAPSLESRLSRRGVFSVAALAWLLGGLLLYSAIGSLESVVLALLLGGVVVGGSDVNALGALEQACLADRSSPRERTAHFARYHLLGYLGGAFGALAAVPITAARAGAPFPFSSPHDPVLLLYGPLGAGLLPAYRSLHLPATRPSPAARPPTLSPSARSFVLSLSALLSVDAFGGGLISSSLVVYYFALRYHPPTGLLGTIFFLSNLAAGGSLLFAAPLARRIGLLRTMVFTHLPSNLVLVLLAFAPTFSWAGGLWVGRTLLSQMDVPTRQSYTQALVSPPDRVAAAGYTTAARSSQALGGPITGALLGLGGAFLAAPLMLAGAVKSAYDLAVYARFRRLRPPEEGGSALMERARSGDGGIPKQTR
jgi:MFS family permease